MENNVSKAMDDFYQLVNSTPSTDAADKLTKLAATIPTETAIAALSRLYVIMAARVRLADAKTAITA